MEIDNLKKAFLKNEFLTMSVLGALGRSKTFSNPVSEQDKSLFRINLRKKLIEIGDKYISSIQEEEHLSNIKKIADDLTSNFSHCLQNGRFRIGIAQKALNLYLKYLWCVNLIPVPPHCPFDSIVISYLPECKDLPPWTLIDTIDDYQRLVKAAQRKADGKPIAEWELKIWLESVQSARERRVKESGTEKGHPEYFNSPHEKRASYVPPTRSMPKKGDTFKGKINDLRLKKDDADGWKRRDISFFKHEVNRGERFRYPTHRDRIILIDTEGDKYELNFSKPDLEKTVCLGTPSKLKPWYRKKGFKDNAINPNDKIYFEYTGKGIEFIILTEQEFNSRRMNRENT